LPPAPPSLQMQTAAPSPSPFNTLQATDPTAQSVEKTQASANNPPQTITSAAPTHSLVGIMGTGSNRQTALIKSGDSVKEVVPGELVGAGWTLQSIAENQVTLRQGGQEGQTKVLTLGDP
jgi:Tfp pilus assembly protein PilP